MFLSFPNGESIFSEFGRSGSLKPMTLTQKVQNLDSLVAGCERHEEEFGLALVGLLVRLDKDRLDLGCCV